MSSELKAPAARRPIRLAPPVIALLLAVGLFFLGGLLQPGFVSLAQAINIVRLAAFLGIIAAGQTLVIISGSEGIDLSIGAVVTLSAILVFRTVNGSDAMIVPALLLALGVGALVGLSNGVGIVYLGIPPLVMTLGMTGIVTGLVLAVTQGQLIGKAAPALGDFISRPLVGPFPGIIFIWVLVGFFMWLLLDRTRYGKELYAVGVNRATSRLSGVRVPLVVVATYVTSGVLSAFGGFMLLGFTQNVFLNLGTPYLFPSVAAVVVGGTMLSGGKGSYWGTMAGALVLTLLTSLLTASQLPEASRQIALGLTLLILISIYGRQRSLRRSRPSKLTTPVREEPTMSKSHSVTMLGTGLIGMFYTMTLHGQRGRDQVKVVYSRQQVRAEEFAQKWGIPKATSDLAAAIADPDTDTVVIGLPNYQHVEAVELAAKAGKAILITKPLGRNAAEARQMLETVERAGVFAGYLEDLAYTPKTLKAVASVRNGAVGDVLWVRSRETHSGPHSAWFWDKEQAGGGAIIDLGCHCIEIIRNFVGKNNRPVEVMCWADTLVHPIPAEDNAIGLIRFETGAVGQFEVSWTFRGGMDLRDEVSGTQGTIWLNHFLRTGAEMFTAARGGYTAEKAETETGWLFPVGDEVHELGYVHMFTDMFEAMDTGRQPMETFYDGYVVNAVMDACFRSAQSRQWEPVELFEWRAAEPAQRIRIDAPIVDGMALVKEERMHGDKLKQILCDQSTGRVIERVVDIAPPEGG